MAGHSKWANIKHKKQATDAKRGKIFTVMAKRITVAAQKGGGDPETNHALRTAIEKAKAANVPNTNIERAIKKGTGELKDGARMEELNYEGYGPEGVAILITTITDNSKRTYSNLREIMKKNGGSLGGSGCVSWMFERKGFILCEVPQDIDKDSLELNLIDNGAEETLWEKNQLSIITSLESFEQCLQLVENFTLLESEVSLIPSEHKNISKKDVQESVLSLVEKLEDNEDVDSVYHNMQD